MKNDLRRWIILVEAQSLSKGETVFYQPPIEGERRWGGAQPPPRDFPLTVKDCRLKDGQPFWYGVESASGTYWRVWADHLAHDR